MTKLKKGDITLREVYLLSLSEYKKGSTDNKKIRANLDVLSAKLIFRTNLFFNRRTGKWEQSGLNVKFTFLVKSDPISYTKQDTLKYHTYEVIFLLREIEKGLDSPVRIRVGSNRRPIFPKKGASREERIKILNKNIKNGIQMDFLFSQEYVYKRYGLLFGSDRTTHAPLKTNPDLIPRMSKHEIFVLEKLLIPILNNKKFKLNQIGKNINRSK